MNKPFSLLVKPASADCNLRCSYCFYIDHIKMFSKDKTHRMSDKILERMIKTYMETDQSIYSFGWQGGEPTLMGVDFFKKTVKLQKKYGRQGARVSNGLQTNTTLIDDEFAAFLKEYNFLVGVSLDGPEEIHDYYRVNIDGKGSHSMVLKGIEALNKHDVDYNVLVLVNKQNVDKAALVYKYLKDMGVNYHQYIPCVEFDDDGNLLPYAITGREWGNFLMDIFNEWYPKDTRKISVRLFDSVLSLIVEGNYTTCHLAGNCCQYFVVEYNGDIYPCDFFVQDDLRLGNVMSHSWSVLQHSRKYKEFGALKTEWNKACQNCDVLPFCSGDCLKHRLYENDDPRKLSHLCQGRKLFFRETSAKFKQLAHEIIQMRNNQMGLGPVRPGRLFPDIDINPDDPCYCGSGKRYRKCHGR